MVETGKTLKFTPPLLPEQVLNAREDAVFQLLALGLSYPEIAHELRRSQEFVESKSSSIYLKCGVKNQVELLSLLLQTSLWDACVVTIVGEVA